MRKLVLFVIVLLAAAMFMLCRSVDKKLASRYPHWVSDEYGNLSCINTHDYPVKIEGLDVNDTIIVNPGDTFPGWHPWDFPDSIKVAFTRNGVFEDSIYVYPWYVPKDSLDGVYVMIAAVGDIWFYNLKGEFVKFYESPLPHSGAGHKYIP